MRLLDEQYAGNSLLWRAPDDGLAATPGPCRQSQAHPPAAEADGDGGDLSKPRLSQPAAGHEIYPYLLRGVTIARVNQVWSADITYICLASGFVYLVAVIDWFSRSVLAWATSITMDVAFCVEALDQALQHGRLEIFNTDQGAQFTSLTFTERLKQDGVRISMDGRGRVLDNVFVERLGRRVKCEKVYVRDYQSAWDARRSLARYFAFYNEERLHQALDYQTPAAVYQG